MTTAHDIELRAALERVTAERDELAEELDGVENERDALREECDEAAAERDTLANANTVNVGLLRKAEAERDAAQEDACRQRTAIRRFFEVYDSDDANAVVVELESLRDTPGLGPGCGRACSAARELSGETMRERDAALAELAKAKSERDWLRKRARGAGCCNFADAERDYGISSNAMVEHVLGGPEPIADLYPFDEYDMQACVRCALSAPEHLRPALFAVVETYRKAKKRADGDANGR